MRGRINEMDQDYFKVDKMTDYKIDPPVKKLIASSSNQQFMCFIAEYPLPFVAPWGSNLFETVGPLAKCTEIPTCFSIAQDSSALVLGYGSGNIFIFNPKNKGFIKQIIRATKDDSSVAPITQATFAQDNQSIVACDKIGNIFQILRFTGMSPKEVNLFSCRMPLKNVFMPTTDANYLIFSDQNSTNVLDIANHDFTDIASSPLGENIHFDAKVNTDGSTLVVVWHGNSFSMFRVSAATKISTLFEYSFEQAKIKEAIIRKNFVVSIIFVDGSIDLVIGSQNPRIERYFTAEIKKIIRIYQVWTKSHETLFMLTPKSMFRIKFIEWDERLNLLSSKYNFLPCYQMAEGIYTGSNLQVFGIDPDTSTRCSKLQKAMEPIFMRALDSAGDNNLDLIAATFDSAMVCDMPKFITEKVYKLFDEDEKLYDYFIVIFQKMKRNITHFIPFSFFEQFFEVHAKKYLEMTCSNNNDNNTNNDNTSSTTGEISPQKIQSINQESDDKVAQMILNRGIPQQYAGRLLKLAHNRLLNPLLLHLWTECFEDFISPAIMMLKMDDLVSYMSAIFISEKYNLLPVHKKLLVIWFCTSFGGTYPRLLTFFSKDWNLAPTFASKFVELLPIELRNGTVFGAPALCDAILRIAASCPDYSLPTLDVVGKLIVDHQVKIPQQCISILAKWAFETKVTQTSIRESVLMLIHEQYPKLIVYPEIIDYCEAAGFARIANNIYLPSKNYDRVIQTMAISEEWRPHIFQYIRNPYLDPLRKEYEDSSSNEINNNGNENEDDNDEAFIPSDDEDGIAEVKKKPSLLEKVIDKATEVTTKTVEVAQGVAQDLAPDGLQNKVIGAFVKAPVEVDPLHPTIIEAQVPKTMKNEFSDDMSSAGFNMDEEEDEEEDDNDKENEEDSDSENESKNKKKTTKKADKKGNKEEESSESDSEENPHPKVKVIIQDQKDDDEEDEDEDKKEEYSSSSSSSIHLKKKKTLPKAKTRPIARSASESSSDEDSEKKPAQIVFTHSTDEDDENDEEESSDDENSDSESPKKKKKSNSNKKKPMKRPRSDDSGSDSDEESGKKKKSPRRKSGGANEKAKKDADFDKPVLRQRGGDGTKPEEFNRRLSTRMDSAPVVNVSQEELAMKYTLATDTIMQEAVKKHLALLVLINPNKAVELIGHDFVSYARSFIKKESNPYVKFLYLRSFADSTQYSKILLEEDHFELFELTCKFSPPDVLPMLKTSQSIEIDKALPVCNKHRVIDACIYIHTMLGDMQSAVNLVAEELEADLVDAIQSGNRINAPSIDLVKEDPELKKAYETVLITFELLSKAPNQLTDRMWKDIFLSFQLPLWLVQESKTIDEDTKRSICYFFAFFIVETLQQNRSSPDNIFNTYLQQFKEIDQGLYRTALSAVFKYLDYNQKLSDTVIQLLMEDCINLYDRAQRTKTRAAFVYHNNCVFCNTPITGAGGIGALVFECGHAYHDDQKCGQHRSSCMVCKGEMKPAKQDNTKPQVSTRAQQKMIRNLMRVDNGLRRHYGKDQDLSDTGNNTFFFTDVSVQVKSYLVVKTPEKWPEPKALFLEL